MTPLQSVIARLECKLLNAETERNKRELLKVADDPQMPERVAEKILKEVVRNLV